MTREAQRDRRGPGDVLIAFTDGVTEALNPEEEEFGDERLKNCCAGPLICLWMKWHR